MYGEIGPIILVCFWSDTLFKQKNQFISYNTLRLICVEVYFGRICVEVVDNCLGRDLEHRGKNCSWSYKILEKATHSTRLRNCACVT